MWRAALAVALMLGCAPSATRDVHSPVTRTVDVPQRATPHVEPTPPSEPAPPAEPQAVATETPPIPPHPDLGPIDQRGTRCFPDRAVRHAIGTPAQHPDGSFRVTVHASKPAGGDLIRARPGETIRFEVALENAGTVPLAFSENDIARLRTLAVTGLGGSNWTQPITIANDALRPGHRLEPGAMLRLCASFEIGATPIDAVSPSDEPVRVYTITWPGFFHEGIGASGRWIVNVGQTIQVRYPRERGAVVREPESWGGVIVIEPIDGASIVDIARATGVRMGSGVELHRGRGGRALPDDLVLVQAPPHMSVRAAAEALEARDDVVRARPLMRGDPGTEGCSEHSPCARGEVCCYRCGIAGCPNSCGPGPDCPTNIP